MHSQEPRFEALEPAECRRLLAATSVGRVIYTDRALPAVRPVTFLLDDDSVVFRTAPSTRLALAAPGSVVALEVDELDPSLRAGWSVIVTGVASLVEAEPARSRLVDLLTPWAPGARDRVLRIPMTLVSGRRIVPAPALLPAAPV